MSLEGITPQFFADNPKCNSYNSEMLLSAAQKTVSCVKGGREGGFPQRVRASQHIEGCP